MSFSMNWELGDVLLVSERWKRERETERRRGKEGGRKGEEKKGEEEGRVGKDHTNRSRSSAQAPSLPIGPSERELRLDLQPSYEKQRL